MPRIPHCRFSTSLSLSQPAISSPSFFLFWLRIVAILTKFICLWFWQKKASDKVKHIIIQTVEELYLETTPKSFGIADLGCSSGPNTLSIIKDIFQAIQGTSHKIMQHYTEFRVYLNDLPTNDFNSIFKALPEFHRLLRQDRKNGSPSIFLGGYPGSFYGRLFPNSSLHFVHSSYSLHWLSRVRPQYMSFFFHSFFLVLTHAHFVLLHLNHFLYRTLFFYT